MSQSPARFAIAACIVAAAYPLSWSVRHLAAFVHTNPARLGFEMMGIGFGLAIFAIGIAFALPGPIGRRLGLEPSRLPLGAVIALVLGTLGLSHAIDAAFSLWFAPALERSVVVGISRGLHAARGHDFAIGLLGTVIAPAVGEELVCRGLIQRALARWCGPLIAIAAASAFFGWMHGELVHGSIAACLGAYIGLAAYWSDSTRPAIAAHAANNVVALLGSAGLFSLSLAPVAGMAGGLALAMIGVVWAGWVRPRGGIEPRAPALQPEGGPADA
jgi:membrane protease YdiL (CAAX protease family)